MSEKKKPSQPSDAALKAKLAQLELENRIRQERRQLSVGGEAVKDTPRRGFGSAQGIAHLRHTEFQRRGPNPPTPPPAIPEPGKAKFGGTYLRTPLPGIIPPESNPGGELIAPVPAVSPRTVFSPKEVRVQPLQGIAQPPEAPSSGGHAAPSGAMPSGRPMPTGEGPASPPKETVSAKGDPVPPSPAFDPAKPKVVGGGSASKAPLPPVYHAGVKSAEAAEKAVAAVKPPVSSPPPPRLPGPEQTIVIPEGSEVFKDTDVPKETDLLKDTDVVKDTDLSKDLGESTGTAKMPRGKRFKNPTMGPTKEE